MTDFAVQATGLTLRFGDVTAVDSVDLEVRVGEVFGLVGPDGAGKSSLIRMLATVLEPHAGDATVFGASVCSQAMSVKPRIGYMSQRFSLYPDLTVRENVDFFAALRGVPVREMADRANRALEFAGLTEFQKRHAEHLSGGMKQKLALAVTLMHEPDLLLLDEPTTGVDPVSRREFWRIIADLDRRGKTVFVATPYMDEAERCTRIAFMDGGRLLLCDTPQALKDRIPGTLFEVEVAPDLQRAARPYLRALAGVSSVVTHGEVLRVFSAANGPGEVELRDALSRGGYEARGIRAVRPDMEAVFAHLIDATRAGDPS